jgi:hypothetical protein
VESVRQLYSKSDVTKVTPQLSSFPSVGSDPERQQVLVLLETWVRVCHEIAQTPALSTEKCRGFLSTLYAQVSSAGCLGRGGVGGWEQCVYVCAVYPPVVPHRSARRGHNRAERWLLLLLLLLLPAASR